MLDLSLDRSSDEESDEARPPQSTMLAERMTARQGRRTARLALLEQEPVTVTDWKDEWSRLTSALNVASAVAATARVDREKAVRLSREDDRHRPEAKAATDKLLAAERTLLRTRKQIVSFIYFNADLTQAAKYKRAELQAETIVAAAPAAVDKKRVNPPPPVAASVGKKVAELTERLLRETDRVGFLRASLVDGDVGLLAVAFLRVQDADFDDDELVTLLVCEVEAAHVSKIGPIAKLLELLVHREKNRRAALGAGALRAILKRLSSISNYPDAAPALRSLLARLVWTPKNDEEQEEEQEDGATIPAPSPEREDHHR